MKITLNGRERRQSNHEDKEDLLLRQQNKNLHKNKANALRALYLCNARGMAKAKHNNSHLYEQLNHFKVPFNHMGS